MSNKQKGLHSGEKNPMFGKKHDTDTRNKISGNTKRFIEENPNKSKPMAGKTLKDVWINKYGNERADNMEKERRIKLSASLRGSKNPMYGKPCHSGSGRGIKGWYKTYFFRSLMELSYIIMLERFGINFVSAERSDLKIKYTSMDGNERTYVADFLVAGKYLVECKPKGLINNKEVKIKELAAKKFCEARGLKYKITTPTKLPQELLDRLISSGSVILSRSTERKG